MAPCDTLADAAEQAREQAEEAATEVKDEVEDAWDDTRKATQACVAAVGGFAVNIGLGLLATPTCLEGVWEAVTSWCEVREAGGDAGEAAKAAKEAQAAYLACLSDHKRT